MEHYEVGLYREQTGIVIGAATITVSQPVASNCHAHLRNKPSADDNYTLGFEFVRVTTCTHGGAHTGAYIAAQINSVTGAVATLGFVTWNGDTVTVGYYAKGTGVTTGTMSVKDADVWRAEHFDSVFHALDAKGHVAPTEVGYVYDLEMASQTNMAVRDFSQTFLVRYQTTTVGDWSFANKYPYYVTSVRVECKASSMEAGKGISIKLFEYTTQLSFGAGGNDLIVNDNQGWWITTYNDGVDTWYVSNIYLGMVYCDDFRVKLITYNGNAIVPAGDVRLFVSGWHMPDPLPEFSSMLPYADINTDPLRVGMYRVENFVVSATNRISVSPTIAVRLTGDLRTAPHFLNDFRNGVEYVKNITTSDYITSGITGMGITYIDLNAASASENDVVEVGYYAMRTNSPDTPMMDAGDLVRREDVDGLEAALAQVDRIDFGKNTFPYGVGEYEWNDRLWQQYVIGTQDKPASKTIGTTWTTVLSFDAVSYNSRKTWDEYKDPVTLRDTYSIDETPFFLTGIVVKVDANGVSGGIRRNDRIALRVSVNGTTLRQGGGTVLYYYPLANSKNFGTHLAPLRLSSDDIMNGTGHMFYIPLGIVRGYSLKVDMRVEAATAFTTVEARAVAIEGWIPDEV